MNTVTATIDIAFEYVRMDSLNNLLNIVSNITQVAANEIRGRNKKYDIAEARMLYCAAACHLFPSKSTTVIGKFIEKDHSTVIFHREKLNYMHLLKDIKSQQTIAKYKLIIQKFLENGNYN